MRRNLVLKQLNGQQRQQKIDTFKVYSIGHITAKTEMVTSLHHHRETGIIV
jgi:hypothetical protein